MELQVLGKEEQKYTYSQNSQIMAQTGCVGYVRGNFGKSGTEFLATWHDQMKEYKTETFRNAWKEVMEALQREEQGLLKDKRTMQNIICRFPGSSFTGHYCTEYGFRVDTKQHTFLLRCNPNRSDYNFYCYCYVSKWLDRHLKNAGKGIQFIDPYYKELFRIPDGGSIVITDKGGNREERICRFIDEYHIQIGQSIYHKCEFAEIMNRKGFRYESKEENKKMEREKQKEKLVYCSEYIGETEVVLYMQQYRNNGQIFLGLAHWEDGGYEPFANITVNIDEPTPDYCGYLDTNNLSNVEKFVVAHKLGEFTGFTGRSGYCEYPLYRFNAEKLRELCPQQMTEYERSIGVDVKRVKKELSR